MSNRSKGSAREITAERIWDFYGWAMTRARRAAVFIGAGKIVSRPNDFWGCIDLIGLRRNYPVVLIQVGEVTSASQKRKKIETALVPSLQVFTRAGERHFRVLLMLWGRTQEKGYHFRVEELLGPGEWRRIGTIKNNGTAQDEARTGHSLLNLLNRDQRIRDSVGVDTEAAT